MKALIPLLLLASCGTSYEPGYKTTITDNPAAAKWITDTVRAANPMSDEEPEDNIRQAERTAMLLFGEITVGVRKYTDGNCLGFIPYADCTPEHKALIDNWTTED